MNINTLDLNLLKALDALLAEPSVSGAAQRLGLSQPATSAALARLRHALGDPLLVRRGNAMVRTARAEELKPRIAELLDEIARTFAPRDAFDPATSTRHLRILANDYATLVVLTPLARRLRERAPGLLLEILPFDRHFEERFAAREADLVVGDGDSLRGYRHAQVLFTEHYLSLVRAGHPRLGQDEVTLDGFLAEDHALVSSRGRVAGVVDKPLAALGRSRRVVLTFPHFLVAPAVVSHTDLVMTVPECIAHSFAESYDLRLFEPPVDAAPFDVAFAWPARSVADPAIRWLRQQLEETATALRQQCQKSHQRNAIPFQ
ncbi:LysR family transcriptional regulator [Brenneria tiliae]|uniref:LysR family transcriptional regulator n=1 Tax=Brenneria tiliae TaxID=2914984 RepID=UPI002014CC3A|nr:LysR family transcriptional regulator [Brenneria tiliae]MCL2899682.1 LysR family transcriptional regulator [Brenneria tiliae]MCL2904060.1 LysR family transcriptional regulator [Brenneria tiliae]